MTSDAQARQIKLPQGYILYDPSRVAAPRSELFDPDWLQRHGQLQPVTSGRGEAWLVDVQQQHWVLRRYLRGGLVARFNRQLYLGWDMARSRAWREWHLLQRLHRLGLPVPRPIAARIHWPWSRVTGLYQASILVERIAGARTLAQYLQQSAQDQARDDIWKAVGACIARFHRHNVYHADLNANNILLDEHDRVYLIDFDRGAIRPGNQWKQSNLQRLHRSLLKLQGLHELFNFDEGNWTDLLAAYQASSES